ncbi:polysaccharide pyruvyl transferase family protein [Roseovarius sp. D22-M7]|uniref:polysaccharide pyruvyl transferase family protein n=1 Tax=Roseovarius sp. D22-M7 TaxID=3127116 RepID=UPI00300FDC98
MLSVDLAFENFCHAALGDHFEVSYFNIEEAITIDCGSSRCLHYEFLHSPERQLSDSDIIVIWGDFTTSSVYVDDVLKHLVSKLKITETKAIDIYLKGLLLEECPDSILKKVLIVSSNLLPNAACQMSTRYRETATRLYSQAAAIIPRDPMSAAIAQIFRGNPTDVSCGVDAAFFLATQSATVGSADRIGFSFGRTAGPKSRLLRKWPVHRFTKALSRAASLPLYDIGWKSSGGDASLFYEKLEELRRCRLIVTDTYHCAINAMREGVPVICVGEGARHQFTTLGDKKKEFLFHAFMAQGLYAFSDNPQLIFSTHRVANEYLGNALDDTYAAQIRKNIEIAKSNQIIAFQSAIRKLVS